MDPREEEVVLNVACGLDPLTAIVAADDPEPPKRKGAGCLSAIVPIVAAWVVVRVAGL